MSFSATAHMVVWPMALINIHFITPKMKLLAFHGLVNALSANGASALGLASFSLRGMVPIEKLRAVNQT